MTEKIMKQKNIILCGFMGCGKSTVGSLLAKKNGMAFVDLDSYIEKKEGKTISEIFSDSGEAYFRALEREASKELSAKNGLVIAAGGGTLTFQENVDVLRENGKIVLLDIPVEVVAQRLVGDTTRPLLNRPDRDEAMKELYEKRLPVYRKAADVIIDGNQSPLQVCMEIMSIL
ncbi:MAG: shikimate kinase [Clostridia bacterium]|nr:shikimate kinase [Clostridia bacterium]